MTRQDRNAIWGLLIIIVGLILLLDSLGFINFNFWHMIGRLWPLALIILGLMIILKHERKSSESEIKIESTGENSKDSSSHESTAFGMFGDIRIAGLSHSVGDIHKSLLLGDIVLDLSGAKLAEGENRVELSVLIGDIDMIVPSDFPMSIESSCLVGSISCDSQKSDGFAPKINFADDNFESAPAKLFVACKALIGDIKVFHKVK